MPYNVKVNFGSPSIKVKHSFVGVVNAAPPPDGSSTNSDQTVSVAVPSGVDVPFPDTNVSVENTLQEEYVPSTPIPAGSSGTLEFPDTNIQLKKSNGTTNISTPQAVASGGTRNVVVPVATARAVDSDNQLIIAEQIEAGDSEDIPIPDGTYENTDQTFSDTVKPGEVKPIPDINVTVQDQGGNTIYSGSNKAAVGLNLSANVIQQAIIYFDFPLGVTVSSIPVTAFFSGDYDSFTQDGSSGDITFSKDDITYFTLASLLPALLELNVGDTIYCKRTISSSAGNVQLTGLYDTL